MRSACLDVFIGVLTFLIRDRAEMKKERNKMDERLEKKNLEIREIQDIYRILFQRNYNNSQAIDIIEAEMEATPERDEIIQFIKDSHRGIMKGYYKAN